MGVRTGWGAAAGGGGRQRFDAREREVRLQVERRETEWAAEREELQRRIRELEALLSGSGGDKAELTLLRTKVKQLQDTLEKEVRCSQDQQRNANAAEEEARVVRGDLKVVKEKLEKIEKAEKDNKSEVEVCPCALLCAASSRPAPIHGVGCKLLRVQDLRGRRSSADSLVAGSECACRHARMLLLSA